MYELFTVTGGFFWVAMFAIFLLGVVWDYQERFGAMLAVLVLAVAGTLVFSDAMQHLQAAPWWLLAGSLVGYVAAGLIWMLVRWELFQGDIWRQAKQLLAKFAADRKLKIEPADGCVGIPNGYSEGRTSGNRQAFVEIVKYDVKPAGHGLGYDYLTDKWEPATTDRGDNLERLWRWVIFWPLSILSWALRDAIAAIIRRFAGLLDRMAKRRIQ